MDQIQEFQSTSFHHGSVRFFEVLLILGAAAAFWCMQRRRYAESIAIVLWAHFSLVAARNIPLFVFVASPSVASMLAGFAGDLNNVAIPSRVKASIDWLSRAVRQLRPFELVERWHITSFAVFAYVAFCIVAGRPDFEGKFSKQFPESSLAVVQRAHPARIFTTDQWGDYFLYHFFPSAKVFIDGRSDFYGSNFVSECRHILSARWDWETDLNRFMVDMVILTPETPVATVLKNSAHWQILLDDGAVVVFARRADVHSPKISGVTEKQQEFSYLPIRHSAVVRNGRRQLGAVSACKYGITTYSRRQL
jgi:hypothetical protein